MNCIFLLLLLSCGGWGNDGRGNGCGCMETGRRDRMDGGHERMNRSGRGRDDGKRGRRNESCGCVQERSCSEPEPCGCAREERECDGPSSGIIPPPWQDYPRFPRRDNGEDCES